MISFGKEPLTPDVIAAAEEFLVDCIFNKRDAKTFVELKYEIYRSSSFECDLEKLPPTTASIVIYKKRAHYHVTFLENIDIDPLEYDYLLKDVRFLPDTECQEVLCDSPIPCSCLTL